MAVTLDIGLIVIACIIPFVLVFFNLVVMAHYIDPEAAAGHVVAKLAIVSALTAALRASERSRARSNGSYSAAKNAFQSLSKCTESCG